MSVVGGGRHTLARIGTRIAAPIISHETADRPGLRLNMACELAQLGTYLPRHAGHVLFKLGTRK